MNHEARCSKDEKFSLLFKEASVEACRVLDFADWAIKSAQFLGARSNTTADTILAIPPIQRSAVWNPKQVIDLWDSLFRGLPIGTFYLVPRSTGDETSVVDQLTQKTVQTQSSGFNLLDGQQRLRALLTGINGPGEEKRCLWIDLSLWPRRYIRLTSKAQPFGYDVETGRKLRLDDRRKARGALELDPKHRPLQFRREGELGRAYDLDLFDGPVFDADGVMLQHPPLPYGARQGYIFPLHVMLKSWRDARSSMSANGPAAFASIIPDSSGLEKQLQALHDAFCRVEKAQVALLKADPANFEAGAADMLSLFERIGGGGTPLSAEERLYSIYKHFQPNSRDMVNSIHENAGRVLEPTKIVGTALRIARANSNDVSTTPDPAQFVKLMEKESVFREKLDALLPRSGAFSGLLEQCFVSVKTLLAYDKVGAEDWWLPDILLAELPAELWQVLVFWATNNPTMPEPLITRQELVRFALFWRLCVWNDEKAALASFKLLQEQPSDRHTFPGYELYRLLTNGTQGEAQAHALLMPNDFQHKLHRIGRDSPEKWRTDEQRFGPGKDRNNIGSNWWWFGAKMLPWLQKEYLRDGFRGYQPLGRHEDDLPYDIDHVCAWNEWGNWRQNRYRFDNVSREMESIIQTASSAVGDGIGNKRLISSSENRSDQDDDIGDKLPSLVQDGDLSAAEEAELARSGFSSDLGHRALWKRVSRPGTTAERKWNSDRLAAFQDAVETRAIWLYKQFYEKLGYKEWETAESVSNSSVP